ncbi:hypothetical protein MCOR02_010510 [Pyricularia oryzae]|nr:hypothetical protein MCOR02_010510 [Pyricularia oryzae]KAI6475998.1 hypothetical protein MCOR17_001283 [Pyricularia oryzae]KAI6505292.1 hypothetical protein MCOR13_004238 [Pyricularia oryzae]KAI6608223.1 hypothetical protein MCOR04_000249 [Pyricularia oryzae]KAI6645519.1 hypothetical protein MCOR14_000182 [Pyricularia oryzae]
MWLINTKTLRLEQFDDPSTLPKYAILSHTWENDEVSFQDIQSIDAARQKKGFSKIVGIRALALEADIDFAWVDTCCIDKTDSVELGEAINSMYRWYAQAAVCIVYLGDLPATITDSALAAGQLHACKWFTRGWTLQELIAPKIVNFYNSDWRFVGSKSDHFASTIAGFTNIAEDVLLHKKDPSEYTVAQRMSWASGRRTKRPEDRAYSLMGLFDISMPPVYGEQDRAFQRLQEEDVPESDHLVLYALVVGQFRDGNTCAIFLRKMGPGFFQREIGLPLATIPKNFKHPVSNLRFPWDAPDKVVIYTTPQQHSIQHVRRAIHFPLSVDFRCKFSLKGEQAEIQPNRTDWDPNTRVLFRPEDVDSLHVVPFEVYIGSKTVKLIGLVNWYVPPRIDLVSRDKHPDIFNYLVSIPGDQRRRWIDLSTFIGSSRLRPMGADIVVMVGQIRHRIRMSLSLGMSEPKMYTAGLVVKSVPDWEEDDTAVETGDESLDEMEDDRNRRTPDAWSDSSDSEVPATQRTSFASPTLSSSKRIRYSPAVQFVDADMQETPRLGPQPLGDRRSPSFQPFPPRHTAAAMPSAIEISETSSRPRRPIMSSSPSRRRMQHTLESKMSKPEVESRKAAVKANAISPGVSLSGVPRIASMSKRGKDIQEPQDKKRSMREKFEYLSGLEKERYLKQVRAREEGSAGMSPQFIPTSPSADVKDNPPPIYSPAPDRQMDLE